MIWFVYIVRCSDGTLYTGVAKELERRIEEHNASKLGAKYTRARRPVSLVYSETTNSRSEACRRESQIKQMSRGQKLALINQPAD